MLYHTIMSLNFWFRFTQYANSRLGNRHSLYRHSTPIVLSFLDISCWAKLTWNSSSCRQTRSAGSTNQWRDLRPLIWHHVVSADQWWRGSDNTLRRRTQEERTDQMGGIAPSLFFFKFCILTLNYPYTKFLIGEIFCLLEAGIMEWRMTSYSDQSASSSRNIFVVVFSRASSTRSRRRRATRWRAWHRRRSTRSAWPPSTRLARDRIHSRQRARNTVRRRVRPY